LLFRSSLLAPARSDRRPDLDPPSRSRVEVDGKHLALGGRPFKVRGVTYGGFRPRADGAGFPETDRISTDLQAMAAAGLNVVRTYTLPPPDLLDLADEFGLHVLVGIHYEDWRVAVSPGARARRHVLEAGRNAVSEALDRCAGRTNVLGIAVGNEVPGDLVRLHGIRAVQDVLCALVEDVHGAREGMLATYCNYPTTEYFDVRGVDFVSFNVFLETEGKFRDYLRHLQVVASDLPLVITELGLAAQVHGEGAQAATLATQLRLVDEAGCAGATVFSWTDDWWVGGSPVEGWGFGVTNVERDPKPALDVVAHWARARVRDLRAEWPSVSVIVCAYNEEIHLEECLASLLRSDYPNLEVIVCDDGSTDRTLDIARRSPFRVLALPHQGLSVARNAGLAAAGGDIVAYLDADAACHPEWPYHLALAFEDDGVGMAGGPNLPVPGTGFVERAVAESPGGPIHVLLSDTRAEHVPGCNMAFRKDALVDIGGFDPIFTAAGDDLDVCWRLQDKGHHVAYSAAASVLHHRRGTLRGYLRQQRTYGKAERVVSGRHPHRCKSLGRAQWSGSIYAGPRVLPALLRPVVYHGRLGMAPFQTVVRRRSEALLQWSSALLPIVLGLALLGALAPLSRWWLVPVAVATTSVVVFAASIGFAVRPAHGERHPVLFRSAVAFLHVVQPLARTWGRIRGRPAGPAPRQQRSRAMDRGALLTAVHLELSRAGLSVREGGSHQTWDLELRAGLLMSCRFTSALGWGSAPQWHAVLRPRWSVVVLALACGAVTFSLPWLALSLAGTGLALGLAEARVLRTRLRKALAAVLRDVT
jgi:glycosyltransferase involved in cell wall biosynthesis/exo-beta-1,3-glucanase (GH17 family)